MYFKFNCPHCERSLKVSQDRSGKKVACPYCHNSLVVPDLPADAAAPSAPGEFNWSALAAQTAAGASAVTDAAGRSAAGRPRESMPIGSARSHSSAGSDVSLVTSGAIGFVCASLLFAALYPFRTVRAGGMFWDSFSINFPTTLLMFWSFAILFLKWRQLARQKSAMLLDLLPTDISQEITLQSLDRFAAHINSLPADAQESILVNRVRRGIEHFRVRKSAAETVTMMESQSAIDASNVAGSYTIIKVFIWAMPILGFIGTVMGVSSAVSGLSATLQSANDISAVTESMKGVFGGLGVAFDTTLLALVMSMAVKIPTSAMQKSEDGVVTVADEYCNENLLRRLNDDHDATNRGGPTDARVFREAVEAALGTHHAELENWMKKLDAIGSRFSTQIAQGWEDLNRRMQERHQEEDQHLAQFRQQYVEQVTQLSRELTGMTSAAGDIQRQLAELTSQTAAAQKEVEKSAGESAGALQTAFVGLERGLTSLGSVLESLGEKQVLIQQVEAPRRWWFSRKPYGHG
ncbi:MotA/TolQ/ExbB proton channel family protein [Planctomyces sp. SH-PL14]|uniref:MotA/TolQ/ExbB proton channel family protein n=1 Tax=Planctomyces sp. SH-PL14 TaxID=1632864 RepID=UPI00078C6AD8|nr:MotA/TolQ/ExbB proton channel family protein [Planctomyces sp. SH-PL14]AMV18425.1 hypothetical protein VT03_11075 [Planctomyces sp. SH-PL14]